MLRTALTTFCLLFLFGCVQSFAQNGIIAGYINDADTKNPLPGVNINLSSNNKADNSDAFGFFRFMNIPAGQYELIASHVGYKTEITLVEVKENLTSTVNLNLKRGNLDLAEVRVNSKTANGLNTLGQVDILLRPVNSSQEVLRIVPGMFIAQHAGGGKAEQIFLRGFDIDHGTDIALHVDGIPVNMVSHAHGQGYADLHFLIPETIERVGFEMGPYTAAKGNLATAGHVDFKTKDFLEKNSVKIEAGRFNMQRITGLFKLFNQEKDNKRQQLFLASEYFRSNSYFESPQHFHRFNVMAKYNLWLGNQSHLTIAASAFNSKWDASGQIPERAVSNGMITRFGSIDDSEGGNTSRANASIRFSKQLKNSWKTIQQLYFSHYSFNLYSNFTFFLDDPVSGDAINQREKRNLFGYTTHFTKTWLLGNKKVHSDFGAGFRFDDIMDISLSKVVKRQFLSSIQKGDIRETNVFLFGEQQLELGDQFTLTGGLRVDHFRFGYKDELVGQTGFAYQSRGILSPKVSVNYTPSTAVKLYLNNGIGFHSNDARVILSSAAENILPKVYSTDLGIILKLQKNLVLKTTFWHLYSEQEFVYVGDAGIVEPGGKTRRMGIDFSARYQLNSWLFADADLNVTRARAIEETKGEDYVPLSSSFTSIGGVTAKTKDGFSASLRYRFIADRPANEDYSVKAPGYFIMDLALNYHVGQFDFFASMENILNRKWNEAQFDTRSRLQMEPLPVSEIHFTPGTPRFIKAGVSVSFGSGKSSAKSFRK